MNKNKIYIIPLILFFALLFNTCKKYDDGGLVALSNKHLFGHNRDGAAKTWKLKLYEVNGIDSTYLIRGANAIPNFYDNFISFKLEDKKFSQYSANTFLYYYQGTIDEQEKKFLIGSYSDLNNEDSTQCKVKDNVSYCWRNIFFPEIQNHSYKWKIERLKKNEFVLTLQMKNSYKIILEY